MVVGEKGMGWRKLRFTGTPAHGSMPWQSDNAVVKAAEAVRRIGAAPEVTPLKYGGSGDVFGSAEAVQRGGQLLFDEGTFDEFDA